MISPHTVINSRVTQLRDYPCASTGPWLVTEDPPNLQVQHPDGTIAPHTLHSPPGFDNVTGLGVPKGDDFLKAVGEKKSDGRPRLI
jgi:hypothetical protein